MVEKYPHQMPEFLGTLVYVGCFIDADNSGNIISGSLFSVIVFKQRLFNSFSKHQNKVELKNGKQINI